LDKNLQKVSTLVGNATYIQDIIETGDFENPVLEEIMLFIQKICLKLIRPKLEAVKGNELFQLARNFWEKFIIFVKL
jgi:hypothetical protein